MILMVLRNNCKIAKKSNSAREFAELSNKFFPQLTGVLSTYLLIHPKYGHMYINALTVSFRWHFVLILGRLLLHCPTLKILCATATAFPSQIRGPPISLPQIPISSPLFKQTSWYCWSLRKMSN